MKTVSCLPVLILTGVFSMQAQTMPVIKWQQSFGGTDNDGVSAVIQTQDGGYILGGASASELSTSKTSANFGDVDYWIVKTDADGNRQWENSYGGLLRDGLASIQQTSDGGYVLGGISNSDVSGNKNSEAFGSFDYWLIKVDSIGNKEWERSFGGTNDDELNCVRQTGDGGFILGGQSSSDVSGNKTRTGLGDFDYWVIKLDANGNKQWERSFGGDGRDSLYSLQELSDGGYILGGYSNSGLSDSKTNMGFGGSDYWVVKIDSNGTKQWERSYGGDDRDWLLMLQQTTDCGFVFGGSSCSGVSGNKTSAAFGACDYWVVKVDADGNKQWEQSFGGSGNEELFSLQQTSDGGYILGGWSDSGVSGNKTSEGFGAYDFWVVKIDANGNKQWEKSLGGSDEEYLNSLRETGNGGYILAGGSRSGASGVKNSVNFGGSDCWLVKLEPPYRIDSFSFNSNNFFQIQVSGVAGTNYIFQTSIDLTNWISQSTNTAATNGLVNFLDTNAARFSTRYYRTMQQ